MSIRIHGILILLVLINASCKENRDEVSENERIKVQVQKVIKSKYIIPVKTVGTVHSASEIKLSFKTGGIISRVFVSEGQQVKKGQILAQLNLSEIEAQSKQAKLALEKAERDLNRAENLYKDSVATLEQYQNAQTSFEIAKMQKQIADFNLIHSTITAPSDGKILKKIANEHEMIAPGYPVFLFAGNTENWIVKSGITDKDIVWLKLGDSAHIHFDAYPQHVFKAYISETASMADPITSTFEIEFSLENSNKQLITGMIAKVDIFPSHQIESLEIPIESLIDGNENTGHVFIAKEGQSLKREIKIFTIKNDKILIFSGLSENEEVITEGAHYVSDGSLIIVEK